MLVYSIKMFNGKPLVKGRVRIKRHSDKFIRYYANMINKRWGGRLR